MLLVVVVNERLCGRMAEWQDGSGGSVGCHELVQLP